MCRLFTAVIFQLLLFWKQTNKQTNTIIWKVARDKTNIGKNFYEINIAKGCIES